MRRTTFLTVGVLVAVVVLAGCGGGSGSSDDEAATTSSSTVPSPTDSSTSASTSSEPAASSTTPPSTVPPSPVAVLVVGDSVGYTLAEHFPGDVPSVTSVEDRALPGCGLITSGERPPAAVDVGAPPLYDDCGPAIADADAAGLATDPDVVLLVTGAWERSEHVRDGRTVGPGDAAWTEEIKGLLQARVEALSGGGVPVALWADVCGEDAEDRSGQEWYRDEVVLPVAEATRDLGTTVVDPESVICRDGLAISVDGVGNPRPEDGQHWSPEGAAWLWRTWLGPQVAQAAAA